MPSEMKTSQFDLSKRMKKALKLALEDVKEKHAGVLLSANAYQVTPSFKHISSMAFQHALYLVKVLLCLTARFAATRLILQKQLQG